MVRGVLVCVCACAFSWAAAADGDVRREVDRIFEAVGALAGGGTQPRRAEERAFAGPTAFPVGVVLSDKLYPLVVGRDLETGAPFVMNLDKQHALVVARGGADDYRMVIPFPVVLGSEGPNGDGRSPGPPSGAPHRPYGREPPNKYFADGHTHGGYYDGSPPPPPPPPRDAYEPSKVPGKYASDHHPHRDYYDDDAPNYEDSRYKAPPPKKYSGKPDYINYFGVDHRPAPAVSGKYVPFSMDRPVSRYRVRNYTRYLSPEGELSYHVAGPKYTVVPQFPHRYNSPAQQYRATGPPVPVRYSGPGEQQASPEGDFRPSPYLGSIPDDEPSTPAPADAHSEEFDSYDDREPDYVETSSGTRPGSSVGVATSGGVRHVTHHADDYLGKIYEDMYYKVAPNTYSDGPPSYEAVESRQRNANATDPTAARTGPVTFDPPQHDSRRGD